MKAHLDMMKNVLYFTPKACHSQDIQFFVVLFFFIKISCSFQKLSYIQTSDHIQEEIWKQMLVSISGIENKRGMELGRLVEYNRRNIF